MTRTEMKQILDKVLDMGQSSLHNVEVDFCTDTEAIFCSIHIHLNGPSVRKGASCVCDAKYIYSQSEDAQSVLNWLDIWAEIFRKEREL